MGVWLLFPKLHDEGWETLNYEIEEGSWGAFVILGSWMLSYGNELIPVMGYHRVPCYSLATFFFSVFYYQQTQDVWADLWVTLGCYKWGTSEWLMHSVSGEVRKPTGFWKAVVWGGLFSSRKRGEEQETWVCLLPINWLTQQLSPSEGYYGRAAWKLWVGKCPPFLSPPDLGRA